MALDKELETFNREFARLVAESQGKFALVQEDKLVGVFDTFQDAVKSGYGQFKLTPFMVKQILAMEKVHRFSRNIVPCHK